MGRKMERRIILIPSTKTSQHQQHGIRKGRNLTASVLRRLFFFFFRDKILFLPSPTVARSCFLLVFFVGRRGGRYRDGYRKRGWGGC